MRRIAFLFLITLVAGSAIAEERDHHRDPFREDSERIMSEYRDRTPADLTFGEIEELMGALSIPAQQAAYVRKSAMASMMVPGFGQFINDDALSGALFLTADIAIVAGTAVGLYFLMPGELRFDQIDYFNTPPADIHAAWETAYADVTIAEIAPVMGVAAGGLMLRHVVAAFSARHAAGLARESIRSGRVTFEPRAGLMMGPHGRMGMEFGLRY